jgi:uncharacterized protein (TIGR03435 family)
MIMFAYNVPFVRLRFPHGRPDPAYYQVEALAPANTTLDQARLMLQTLLTDRLAVRCHNAQVDTPVDYLVRGSGPLKLTPATESSPVRGGRRDMWMLQSKFAPISEFASFLSSIVHVDVVDKTGISGNFIFNIDVHQGMVNAMGAGNPTEVDAETWGIAQTQAKNVGLKLEAGKEKREYLVLDHYNVMPTPN